MRSGTDSSLQLANKPTMMHFPTSLPRSTRSPSARIGTADPRIQAYSVHSVPYDGPMPILPKSGPRPLLHGRTQIRRKANQRAQDPPPIAPITPVYAFSARQSSNGTDPRIGPTLQKIGNDIGSSPYMTSNPSVPNIDGAGKILSIPKGAKSKLKMGPSTVRKMFGKKPAKVEEDPYESPTEASEFYELKRKKSEKTAANAKLKEKQVAQNEAVKSASSSRARLAARLLRHRGKAGAIETGLDLDDSDHHPFDAAKKRLDDQRERKMRRKSAGSKASDQSKDTTPPEQRYQPRNSSSTQREVRFSNPKEQIDAYRASKAEDKNDHEDEGSRVGNAVRRLSAHLSHNNEEAEAGTRRASWTSDAKSRRNSAAQYADTSSSRPDELPLQVPRAADVPDLLPHQLPAFVKSNDQLQLAEAGQVEYHSNVPQQQRVNPYNQVMFPPKPPAPFFRPTLSPVSSRSPVPTSIGPAATGSPGRSLEKKAVSASPRLQSIEQQASESSIHLPLSEVSVPTPPKKLTIRNGPPTISSTHDQDTSSESAILSPIMEQETPEPTSRHSSQRSSQRSAQKPIATLPQPVPLAEASSEEVLPPLNLERDTRLKPIQPARNNSNQSSATSTARFSEIKRPHPPPPMPSPSPLKIAPNTPTPSALDFWREADSSLGPSESASAQPPNYHGERPPVFWKAADSSLYQRNELGPTMEEWIATLPGLGLGLGTWGSNDGALDWKYFQKLRSGNKLRKSRSETSVKSARDMIVENMEVLERVVEVVEDKAMEEMNNDAGLTPDEAEAVEEIGVGREEAVADNAPPMVQDPGLLHPKYVPGTKGGILEERRPVSRRGRDVAGRLDDMERYWAEQSQVIGKVLKRMLVVVDGLIVKEREQAQKEQRRLEMGWFEEGEFIEELQGEHEAEEAWGCSVT